MPTPTPILGLNQAVSTDDQPTYLVTNLSASLLVLDTLFDPDPANGHVHDGVSGAPVVLIDPYTQPMITTPVTFPPTGSMRIYPKADGAYYKITDAGVETPLVPVIVATPPVVLTSSRHQIGTTLVEDLLAALVTHGIITDNTVA